MNEQRAPLIKVSNLKMHFPIKKGLLSKITGYVKAVDDVSFEIHKGETFGLVGESGCGKTTVGKCILKIHKATEGKIYYKGRDIAPLPQGQIKDLRRELQLIFQDPYGSLDPRQSVGSILREAVTAGNSKEYTSKELKRKTEELLLTVELLPEMAGRFPHELSGGQRQRVGIARALACDPKLIVCDEPVSALDVSIQAQIINLFARLQREMGLTYLFIAHDLAVVKHIASRIGVMYLGHLVEVMDSKDLYNRSMHPYTQALLSAVPTIDYYGEKERCRIMLEGEVPSPIHAPSGCPFHDRCRYCMEECKTKMPSLKDYGGNHQVACYYVEHIEESI